jgi:CMP-N-acetylneuraminic acid synthetase
MIDGRRVLAVCPARGGSKGIPRKNLRPFLGVPLVARVGHLVREIPLIDRAVVSTDDPEIAEVAKAAGLDAPFVRPAALSGDRVADAPVLVHALEATERIDGVRYDVVLMLQPTSPLRRAEDVVGTLRRLVDGDWDAVWSVSPSDSKAHPLKQLVVEAGRLDFWDPKGAAIVARQELTPVYHRNGVAYAISRRCLVETGSILGARTGAYVIPGEMVSIDTLWDLELAELLYRRREAESP